MLRDICGLGLPDVGVGSTAHQGKQPESYPFVGGLGRPVSLVSAQLTRGLRVGEHSTVLGLPYLATLLHTFVHCGI